jgi:hypothetical protein
MKIPQNASPPPLLGQLNNTPPHGRHLPHPLTNTIIPKPLIKPHPANLPLPHALNLTPEIQLRRPSNHNDLILRIPKARAALVPEQRQFLELGFRPGDRYGDEVVDRGGVVRGGLVVFGANNLRLDSDLVGGGEVLREDDVVEAEADGAAGGDFVALIYFLAFGH